MGIHRSDGVRVDGDQLSNATIICAREFDESMRRIVASLKYHGDRRIARDLATLCVEALSTIDAVDVLTWIPTLDAHRESRGFDHAELIARHAGAQMGVGARRLLRRTSTGRQTGRTRVERLAGVEFVAHPWVLGRRICVLDDVCTTGATLSAAAVALNRAGAEHIVCVAAAGVTEKFFGRWQTTDRGTERRH
jgi:predicted amidophosphoribosyltransferase